MRVVGWFGLVGWLEHRLVFVFVYTLCSSGVVGLHCVVVRCIACDVMCCALMMSGKLIPYFSVWFSVFLVWSKFAMLVFCLWCGMGFSFFFLFIYEIEKMITTNNHLFLLRFTVEKLHGGFGYNLATETKSWKCCKNDMLSIVRNTLSIFKFWGWGRLVAY